MITSVTLPAAIDTINYEIVTRLGARVPRVYVGLDEGGNA